METGIFLIVSPSFSSDGSKAVTLYRRISENVYHVILADPFHYIPDYQVRVFFHSPVLDPEFHRHFPDSLGFPNDTHSVLCPGKGVGNYNTKFSRADRQKFENAFNSAVESALIYEEIAERLWELGEGNFTRGFEALFETGRRLTCLDKDFDYALVSTKITDGITVDMGYKNSPRTEGLKVPIIMNIRTE